MQPQPDAQGVARLREIVLSTSGIELSDGQACELLGYLMRYLWLLRRLEARARETSLAADGRDQNPPS